MQVVMETKCHYIYKKLFPRATKEQLVATRNKTIQLKMYNQSTIAQLRICTANKNIKTKTKYIIFVVPEMGKHY